MLERKIIREKTARETAEQQLGDFSWKIFKANSELKTSLEEAQKKSDELDFLHSFSQQIASENSLDEILKQAVSSISAFIDAEYGSHFIVEDGVCIATPNHEIWSRNQQWVASPLLSEKLINEILRDDTIDDKWILSELDELANNETQWCLRMSVDLSEGKRCVFIFVSQQEVVDEESLFVLDTAKGHLISGIRRRINEQQMRDRTLELEQALLELKNAQAQLIQSEKMASFGQLAAGVAHEINNPLGYIRSNLQVLQDYASDLRSLQSDLKAIQSGEVIPAEVLEKTLKTADFDFICKDLADIVTTNLHGVERVADIVKALKTFSHSGEARYAPVAIGAVIEQSLKVVWNELKYKYEVNVDLDDQLALIQGDAGQLQQVFINLFINAIHAMPEGGVLSVRAFNEDLCVKVIVKDTGCGMDSQVLDKLFTPFYTTKPVGQGTGLGLSVSYAILEAHSADITVTSTPNKGTTFTLSFKPI
ncbi:sensor histidine kinase [Aestuariibacter salexigens]|uniref:sensor histidine kinase n=1 Tax=Aestuariibacter salexigens TaxID=226010 RepID=UPI00146F9C98|nr:ATP-binding protein [Aestuariibacter salexigens]